MMSRITINLRKAVHKNQENRNNDLYHLKTNRSNLERTTHQGAIQNDRLFHPYHFDRLYIPQEGLGGQGGQLGPHRAAVGGPIINVGFGNNQHSSGV
jgi:hypothetical protein